MLILISGQPGNGKTLRTMALLQEEYERNMAAVKAGKEEPRRFFTNIAGATTEENPHAFPWLERLPEHNDWTQLPDRSYVVYDEAHSDGQTPGLERYGHLFPSTGRPGESSDPRIRAMSTHRHRGFDIVLVTQWPSKIHHQVRTLVGLHIHMNRSMGLAAAGVVSWPRVQPDPYDETAREKAEEEIWKYPTDLYKRYHSATAHTASHKFRVPKKVWGGISKLVVLLLVMWALWHYLVARKMAPPDDKPTVQEVRGAGAGSLLPAAPRSTDEPELMVGTGAYVAVQTESAPTLAGCVASASRCRCYNTDGYLIDMTQHQCRALLAEPLPFNVYHEYRAPAGPLPGQPAGQGAASAGVVVEGDPAAVVGAGHRVGDAPGPQSRGFEFGG